jgi:hypothetical protein
MWLIPVLAEGEFNWVGLGIALAALAVGWTILRFVLRLTMKFFAVGCLGLVMLLGAGFAYFYWMGG